MKFNSTRNKYKSIYNNSETNKNTANNLELINLISNTATSVKKQSEIILIDKQYITGSSWRGSYQFQNLDDKFLNFLHPYAFLETSEGYSNETTWTYYSYYWWEKFNSTTILKIRADGYLTLPYPGGGYSPSIAPIYITVKIKILNPQLYIEITKSKT